MTLKHYISELETQMRHAAADLEFETAAMLRDEIGRLEAYDLEMPADSVPSTQKSQPRFKACQTPSPPRPRKPTAPSIPARKRQTGTTRPRPNGLAHSTNGPSLPFRLYRRPNCSKAAPVLA